MYQSRHDISSFFYDQGKPAFDEDGFKGTSRARFCILHNVWKLRDNRAYTGYRQPKLYVRSMLVNTALRGPTEAF